MKQEKIAVYPGSFDPVTFGHLDIAQRGAEMFDKLIIAVLNNPAKKGLFTVAERVELIRESVKDVENIIVDTFPGLLIDYMKEVNATVIVKGLRAVTDFDYEMQMAYANRGQYEKAETIFLPTSEKFSYFSSSIVKGFAQHGGPISKYVPLHVEEAVREKYSQI